MNKKQKLAIKRMNRALKALSDADISICGMDNDLIFATKEAIDNSTDYGYPEVANALRDNINGSGQFDNYSYLGSGGF